MAGLPGGSSSGKSDQFLWYITGPEGGGEGQDGDQQAASPGEQPDQAMDGDTLEDGATKAADEEIPAPDAEEANAHVQGG